MQLNIHNWKEFKIKDIFRLEPTKGVDSTELLDGNDINYIGAKHEDNGFMMRCQLEGFEAWVSKGNCIVFIQLGAGSAGYVNYIPNDFIGMSGKTMCGYIDDIMTPEIGLFLETILCKERPKYSFGRSWTGDRLKETIIKLPVDENGDPDWEFMKNYIKSLNHNPITTKNSGGRGYLFATLGKTELWQEFCLDEIFEIRKGKRLTADEQTDGDTPYIGAIDSNNGVANYIGQKAIHDGNTISLSYNGSVGEAFYQPKPFWATDDVNVLYFRKENGVKFNKYIALFFCTVLYKEKYRYSYGRKWVLESMRLTKIKLPTKEGKPDFLFMENYIKSLPYGDRI